ncbi:MAG: hypothetical protein NTU89_00515 [Candidatus Dependentiae bacterium]|nr:hypothetical protein [Candidatus Dependentiae bacterium]
MKKLLKNLILFAVITFCDFAHHAVSQTSHFNVSFNPEASFKPLDRLKVSSNGLRKKDRRISMSASSEYLSIPVVADNSEKLPNHKPLSHVDVLPENKKRNIGVTVTNSSEFQNKNYDNHASQSNYEQGYNQYLPFQNQLNPRPRSLATPNDQATQNYLTYSVENQKPEMNANNAVGIDYKKASKNYVDDYSSPIQNIKQGIKPVDKIATNAQIEVEKESVNEQVSESSSDSPAEPILQVPLPIAEPEINIDQFINTNLEIQAIQEPEINQAEMPIFTGDQNKVPDAPVVVTPESVEAQEIMNIDHIKEDILQIAEVPENIEKITLLEKDQAVEIAESIDKVMLQSEDPIVEVPENIEKITLFEKDQPVEIAESIDKVILQSEDPIVEVPTKVQAVNPRLKNIKAFYKGVNPAIFKQMLPKLIINDLPVIGIPEQKPMALQQESIIKKILNKGGGLWAAFVEKIKNIKLGEIEDELSSDSLISSDSLSNDSGAQSPKSMSDDDLIDSALDKFINDRIEDGPTALPFDDCCAKALPSPAYGPSIETCIEAIAATATSIKCLP